MEIVGAEADLVGEIARQWLEIGCKSRGNEAQFKSGKRKAKSGKLETPSAFTRLRRDQRVVSCNFASLPVAVQRRALQLQLTEIGVALDFELVEQLRESADRLASVGPQLFVLRDATGMVSLRLVPPSGFNANETAVNLAGGAGDLEFDGVRLGWRLEAGANFARPHGRKACESFDADKVGGKITLRHWRPGDRFQPIGLKSLVKLQDLFTNRKIPRARRRELVVAVAENREIFWVEDLRISENFKLTPQTNRQLVWRWQRLAGV
jgi:tRNA(Ile)-lysidine synthase